MEGLKLKMFYRNISHQQAMIAFQAVYLLESAVAVPYLRGIAIVTIVQFAVWMSC